MKASAKGAVGVLVLACLSALGCAPLTTSSPEQPELRASGEGALNASHLDADASLRSRIGPPDARVLEAFAGAGASDITVHELSDQEWAVVDAALAALPELHRRVLQRHLTRLSFLDLQGGAGSALTSRLTTDDGSMTFAITLRASLLEESLSTFLNTKEANLFEDDASGYRVQFDAGSTPALTYVLLHEATHVVDQALGLTADTASPLMAGTWESFRVPAEPHRSSLAAQTRFRGGPRVPLGEAPAYYRALSASPFVSFYASAAASEDIAELFAWQRLSTELGQELTLSVLNEAGASVFQYEPLASPLVRERFLDVAEVLRRDWPADGA